MTITEDDIQAQLAWSIFKKTKQLQQILMKRYYYEFMKLKEKEMYTLEEFEKALPF
jgi:hypothetical protein